MENGFMKKITAYIKKHKLSDVIIALHQVEELTGMTVSDVRGCGREFHVITEAGNVESLDPHAKIEIMCSDDLVEQIVDTIQHAAHTGLRGDGKIYVAEMHYAVRISTGERDDQAV